ncbi:hypothetical protein [Methanopyrus sp.]
MTWEVMVWDERTGRPGVVLFPAGFVGWEECDSIRSPELRSLVLELLDFRV